VATSRAQLATQLDNLNELEQKPLEGTIAVYKTLQAISQEQKLSGLAVKCWPEFFTDLGCAACGAMSMLNSENIPCGCEADINGTITQLIMQWVSGEPSFGSDIVDMDVATDSMVLWHCGQAPFSMAEPGVQKHGGLHSNRRVPLVMEFPLKAGEVTLARLSRASGELRLVIGKGQIIKAPPSFSGTSGIIRFDKSAREVLDTIMREGLEHHVAIAYDDHLATLRALADMLKLPVLNL
jgi:L-fucose isomerase-like protein